MTENVRDFWKPGAILAALLIAVVLPAGIVSASETSPEVAWNVTFAPENNNKFDAVAPTADGGFIALGSTLAERYGVSESLLLVKTDGEGNEAWNASIPGISPAAVAETADGGYIVGAFNVSSSGSDQESTYQGSSFLIRISAAGEEEWRQAIPGMKVSSVEETADGGYAAIGWLWNPPGSENETTAVIVKTDGDGTPAWNRTFPGLSANAGSVTADGGYVIGGTKSPFTYDIGDGFLIRLDADGNTLWQKNYQVPIIFDVEETDDGQFVYSGNYWYGLVDGDGEEVWLRNMEGLSGYAVELRPSGGYVVAGTDARNGEGFVFGTDADGTILWDTAFTATGIYGASSAPGGYTLAGIRFLSPDTSAAWLAGIAEPVSPAPTAAPGFGAAAAGAALLLLLAGRRRRG
ncbi:hypothetical protein [Methanoculleus horonobensis]|jgi:hypothetical protein|uniref:hypothetical protein n=1 Tax=Methanoculleus horonobensis TaxID=528314 RepID=UPI00083276A0|nr:hypothetical protein [Methanoculleus horonobensis]MDD3071696.1 hypothetical protein [Methanoculleus horonobensis]MDD4253197.1 hypothetical protein [Methanoculleus horonobensis]